MLLRAGIFDKPLHVYPIIGPGYVLSVVAIAALGAVLAALLPSLRASRLRPVEALDSM
jgi:ABC-type lipoprotein release transport system permease subunit